MEPAQVEQYLLHARSNSFKTKQRKALYWIQRALALSEQFYIACSFGKDSLCLLSLVLEHKPDTVVLHMDSGYYLPDTYAVKDRLIQQSGINVVTLASTIDYMDIIQQYGLAGIDRSDTDHQKVVSLLKKDKGTNWAKEHGFMGVFLGIRKDESIGRRWNLTVRTPLYQVKDFWHCCPLADWTYRDVFAYLISNNIQYPAFYDFEDMGMTREWIRNSSWVSTDGAAKGQIAWLRKHYPKQYTELASRFPEVKGYV